jgi:hypothetical protein
MASEPRVKYIKLKDSMIITYGVNSITVHSGEYRFSALEEALANGDDDRVYKILEENKRRKIQDMLKIKKG